MFVLRAKQLGFKFATTLALCIASLDRSIVRSLHPSSPRVRADRAARPRQSPLGSPPFARSPKTRKAAAAAAHENNDSHSAVRSQSGHAPARSASIACRGHDRHTVPSKPIYRPANAHFTDVAVATY